MKKLLSILLVLSMVLTVLLSLSVPACADSLYIRKIVSVVYDDSGSMKGNKWAYANYAMQAFCGMLNSEDQLFMTYMCHSQQSNSYDPPKVDLSAGGIQDSVDAIRSHTDSGSTPFTAVETAYRKLQSVDDPNVNTQYWLVVITDGAFDECSSMSNSKKKSFLNEKLGTYADSTMPNGTKPQITFLSINGAVSPDEDPGKGIFTYSAKNATGIIQAMSQMADKISGRTRLRKSDISQIDSKTVRVSSSIPLLNIAVFAQGGEAKIAGATYDGSGTLPITRRVSLGYPEYPELVGGAWLLGDSRTVISAGSYDICFDRDVELEDLVILFEPALEMRVQYTVNGQVSKDPAVLHQLTEGDRLSVSCDIYEMGTDTKIDPQLLPPGTRFTVSILENGKEVVGTDDPGMQLPEWELKNEATQITASVMIEGFNPIQYTANFTPAKYVPKIVYTMTAEYGSDQKSVPFDDIAANKDMTVCFTVYADGVAMTDPEAVKALGPAISVSPYGNDGAVSYAEDGRIVFTPNRASLSTDHDGSYEVQVSCTLPDGTQAAESYTVLVAKYQVFPVDATQAVKKTEFFDNRVGVSFYITKDGVRLDKAAVENQFSVLLNEAHGDLEFSTEVAPDGTITVIPYCTEPYELNFWRWLSNWAHYFGLEGSDVAVTLRHSYGSAAANIDVVDEDMAYLLLNVVLPLAVELFLAYWLYLIITKPRYAKNAVLYVGTIYHNDDNTHTLRDFRKIKLAKYNRIKIGNGRLKPKRTADKINVGGISIRAVRRKQIKCEMPMPWYRDRIVAADFRLSYLVHPEDILRYINSECEDRELKIREINAIERVEGNHNKVISAANPITGNYTIIENRNAYGAYSQTEQDTHDRIIIESGKIFIYING